MRIGFVLMLIAGVNFFNSDDVYAQVNVKIESVGNGSSEIKLSFENVSPEEYLLSVYNFCAHGILHQDIFDVKYYEGEGNATYSGVMDFVGSGAKTEDQFIKIKPYETLSCEIDISVDYAALKSGAYVVKFTANNPPIKNQKAQDLISNELVVRMRARVLLK